MSAMFLAMPSCSRAHTLRGSWIFQNLPLLTKQISLFVPSNQHSVYEKAVGDLVKDIYSEPSIEGIAATRRYIGEMAHHLGHRSFFMMDDDIGFLVRKSHDQWQLRGAEEFEVGELLGTIERLLEGSMSLSHVGVSAREGNNRIGVGSPGELTDTNTRLLRAYGWKTEQFLRHEHGRVDVMEDFDLSLQSLRAGWNNLCLYYWAQGQAATQSPGGCSDYRTREVHDASAEKLAALHDPFVRLRIKRNKTGDLAERKEVTIYWKKAAAAGAAQ